MSGTDERHTWSYGRRISEAAPHGFKHIAIQFLFGIIGLALITFAAIQFHLQRAPPKAFIGPGTISLLYLIVIAFVSLRAGFVSTVAVSLIAVFCMNYFVLPLVPSLVPKNPLDILATVTFLITAWIIAGMVTRLREKCALLDALLEQAPPAIALMDVESRLIRVNWEFTHVFGYTPQEAQGRLPPEVETTLFRSLQESLNNVHRHSGSPRARVHIDRSQASVTMEVQDEGQGMQQGALKRNGNPAALPGVGVAGMRERVRQLGGQLEIHSTPSGTTLKAVLPLS